MCGIAGWLDFGRDLTTERPVVQAMMDTQARRGPDGEGCSCSPMSPCAIAAWPSSIRRTDISRCRSGTAPDLVIVYTGEVYNFAELRAS